MMPALKSHSMLLSQYSGREEEGTSAAATSGLTAQTFCAQSILSGLWERKWGSARSQSPLTH